jgi:hypothetical protein
VVPNDAELKATKADVVSSAQEEQKVVDIRKIDNLMQEALLGRESRAEEPEVEDSLPSAGAPWAGIERLVSQLERETLSPQMLKMAEKARSQVRTHAYIHTLYCHAVCTLHS